MKLVIFGLSITSSWGNGHATTFRALCKALHERGHEIVFYEHDLEWYASNRDMPEPPFCRVRLFDEWSNVRGEVKKELSEADVAVVGSYFPDGLAAIEEVANSNVPVKAFYDIDTPITVAQLREHGGSDYLEGRADSGVRPVFQLHRRTHARRTGSRGSAPAKPYRSTVRSIPRSTGGLE